jgi:hypothetical protein
MKDLLRIYVLWAPAKDEATSKRIADLIAIHFDGIGMERDGVAFRVPVRFRSEAWDETSAAPKAINFALAHHNAIILLHDSFMHLRRAVWNGYVSDLKQVIAKRGYVDLYIPFGSPTGEAPLPCDQKDRTHYAQRKRWHAALSSEKERDIRLLLHVVFAMRQHLKQIFQPGAADEKLFVSHAKVDGDTAAEAIVDYVNDTNQDVPLKTFYDAKELTPGVNFQKQFEREIKNGTLLAIVSDIYDTRPWCIYELTTAKRERRPIVLADVGRVRTNRTYPYGANVPKVRVSETGTAWIESLLLQTMSEGMRCDLIEAKGARLRKAGTLDDDALVLPRPPELFDLTDAKRLPSKIVYPDPPLGLVESGILQKALALISSNTKLMTLSEVR